MTKRLLTILAVIQACLLYKSVDGLKATVCEGGHLPLACPADSYIKVTSAMYGRLDNKTCPYGNITNTNCSETRVTLGALQALCNGQKNCDIDSLSYYFGEPCQWVYKYLTFEYFCMPCENKYGDDAQCEMWALLGECKAQNADWMGEWCSKACYKCEASIEPGCYNVDDDANCTLRASRGECYNNSALMGAYCKKACQLCDQPTPCENKANETVCKAKYEAQECSKNMSYMMSNCTKSCFNCTDTIKCENKDPMCDKWAMQGKCQSESGKMMTLCTKSCLGCSADPVCSNKEGDDDCNYWARSGECSKNTLWMHKNCWRSCTNCSTPHVCDNVMDDALCEVWSANGECSINPRYMQSNCRLSCTRCKALEYGRPKCINSIFNDTLCTNWAHRGECTNNPGFMLTNCYRTCTSCYTPHRIGNDAMFGEELAVSSGATIILPFEFSQTAVLTQFSFFAVNTNPTYFQLWRRNGSYPLTLVYSTLVTPLAAYQAQDFKVQECVIVNATDVVGITTFSGPSPVAYTVSKDFSYFYYRQAAVVGGEEFSFVNAPVKFSLSAEFTPGTLC